MRVPSPLLALAAGVLITLSIPPFGFWPLAIVGVALLAHVLEGAGLRRRLLLGLLAGLGQFVVSWWWMGEFNALGAGLAILAEAAFIAAACAVVPARRGWSAVVVALPGALTLAEAARTTFPFGGIPLGGAPLGQVGGPLVFAARLGGELLLMGVIAALGVALASALRRRPVLAVAPALAALAAVLLGALAPAGTRIDSIDVALVQGGGPRGFRAVDTDPDEVLERHLEASEDIPTGVDLVMWPENVIDVGFELEGTREEAAVSEVAEEAEATLVAGVTADVEPNNFINLAVAWGPDGEIVDDYTKVRRVPFGEYVPGRRLIARLADLSVIPRDAAPGRGPGVLDTPVGRLGVAISYEVFFRERGRSAVNNGALALLVPTNAASFSTAQVPSQEVAASRLRAIETGRWVVQAAPTGFGAFVAPDGDVLEVTDLGAREVLVEEIGLRVGETPYTRVGDLPVLLLAAVAVLVPWFAEVKIGRRGRRP